MQRRLREGEEQFRNLAEQSPNMIFINCRGRVVFANQECERVMGISRAEFYSKDFDFRTLAYSGSRALVERNFTGTWAATMSSPTIPVGTAGRHGSGRHHHQ
jgi:PAS domain-containing protein